MSGIEESIRSIVAEQFAAHQPAIEEMIRHRIGSLFAKIADITPKSPSNSPSGAKRGRKPGRIAKVRIAKPTVSARMASLKEELGGEAATAKPAKAKRITKASDIACAIKECDGDVRTRGLCSKHYQQYRLLEKSKRLPDAWAVIATGEPKSHSLDPVILPRGRAASKKE